MERKPLQLSGQQRALYEALQGKNPQLAEIYLGALTVLFDENHPDRLALAAHGLRELMEKIPEYLDLPVKVKAGSLRVKVQQFSQQWEKACNNSKCHKNARWHGEIDGPLSKFLRKAKEFFLWFDEHYPTRKEQVASMLHHLDPIGPHLPPPIIDLRAREWKDIYNYFEGVSHHNSSVHLDRFGSWLDVLERFLLDRFMPRTFADHEVIDSIIREGDSNA